MGLAVTVHGHFARHAVAAHVLPHAPTDTLQQAAAAAGVEPGCVARALLVEAAGRTWMAILPLSHVLDFAALEQVLGAAPRLLPVGQAAAWFPDCEPGCVPPLPQAYGLDAVADAALFDLDAVVLEAGSRSALVRVDAADFARLTGEATRARIGWPDHRLRRGAPGEAAGLTDASLERLTPPPSVRDRIESVYELPLMPDHTRAILALRNRPDADAEDLAQLVEQDPSLAAQVMRYARSPFFGYRGRVDTLQEAVSRVLGYDLVLNLALGLAALKPFRIPPDGPLGLNAFWQHAALSAALAQRLVRLLPAADRPNPATAYLCGLLHNFGYLVLGQLFQAEFYLLNRMVAANPTVPVTELEKRLVCRGHAREALCAGHAEVGAWLLESWGMPPPVVLAARVHHDPHHDGEHAVCAHLVLLADRLLKCHGVGDGDDTDLPAPLLARYRLNPELLHAEADGLAAACAGMDPLLGQWVA